jgi:hypothetical protein
MSHHRLRLVLLGLLPLLVGALLAGTLGTPAAHAQPAGSPLGTLVEGGPCCSAPRSGGALTLRVGAATWAGPLRATASGDDPTGSNRAWLQQDCVTRCWR